MTETKMVLSGMEELIPGAFWKGSKEQIEKAIANTNGKQKLELISHDAETKRWKLRAGEREIEVQETVSGARSVNEDRVVLAGSDEGLRLSTKLVPPEPGSLDVIVHGSVDDFRVRRGAEELQIEPNKLAAYIKKSGLKFKRIRLLACRSGVHPKGAAQHLANKLGVTVEAPRDTLWIHADGTLTIGPSDTRNTGRWVEYPPQKSASRSQKYVEPAKPATSRSEGQDAPTGAKRVGPDEDDGYGASFDDDLPSGFAGHDDHGYEPGNRTLNDDDAPEVRAVHSQTARGAGVVKEPGQVQIDEHHVFPQEFEVWFKDRGLDIHEFVIDLSLPEHGAQHGGGDSKLARRVAKQAKEADWKEWNAEIMMRLRDAEADKQVNNPGARLTPDQIITIGRDTMKDRGLAQYTFHRYHRAPVRKP